MFANSDRNTNRRIAGYLGGVLGAACVLLAVYPGIAAAAPALDKLTLTSVCTLPKGDAVFLVGNPNASSIPYTWDIRTTPFAGKGAAPAGGSYLQVPSSTAGNTRLFVDGKQQAAKKQNDKECVHHVQPTKRWVDATGDALPSPDVPKGWKLTLDSDYETLVCTWKKDALSCKSKIDVEDKGEFAAEKPYLDVPFGGSYTITETPTPDFVQEGTGKFAVDTPNLDDPSALAKFLDGGEDVSVAVTNRKEAIVAPTTTVDEPTTTTVDEPTTTTVDEPTTTTVDEPTTTAVDEPTTTSVDEPTTTTTVDEPTTTTVDEPTTTTVDEPTTTVDEETTTTVESDDRVTEQATSTTTVDEPTTTEATTTVAPLTTQSPTTTLAPSGDERPADTEATSTTEAPTTTEGIVAKLDSQNGEDLTVRSAGATNDPGAGVAPAHDTLPVTGGAAGAIAILGFALVGIGLVVVALGRRRLV